jgi:hypothetical protein
MSEHFMETKENLQTKETSYFDSEFTSEISKLSSIPYKISSFQNHIQMMLRVASRLWPILRLSNDLQDLSL